MKETLTKVYNIDELLQSLIAINMPSFWNTAGFSGHCGAQDETVKALIIGDWTLRERLHEPR